MVDDTVSTVWERTAERYESILKALEMHSKIDNYLEDELYWNGMSAAITYYGRRIKVRGEIITISCCEFCKAHARHGKVDETDHRSRIRIIGMDCDACEYGAAMGICTPEDGLSSDWLALYHFIEQHDVSNAIDTTKRILDKLRSIIAAEPYKTVMGFREKGSMIFSESSIEGITTGGCAYIFNAEVLSITQHEATYNNEVTIYYVARVKGGQIAPDRRKTTKRRSFTEIRVRLNKKIAEQLKLAPGDKITFKGELGKNKFFGLIFLNVRTATKGRDNHKSSLLRMKKRKGCKKTERSREQRVDPVEERLEPR